MAEKEIIDRLLASYLLWCFASVGVFLLFIALMTTAIMMKSAHIGVLFLVLATGFLWIGMMSLTRHSLVILKKYMRHELSIWEFLSTQFVVIMLPYTYKKIKREVQCYKETASARKSH